MKTFHLRQIAQTHPFSNRNSEHPWLRICKAVLSSVRWFSVSVRISCDGLLHLSSKWKAEHIFTFMPVMKLTTRTLYVRFGIAEHSYLIERNYIFEVGFLREPLDSDCAVRKNRITINQCVSETSISFYISNSAIDFGVSIHQSICMRPICVNHSLKIICVNHNSMARALGF